MAWRGLAFHDELRQLAPAGGLDADSRDVAFLEPAFEAWPHPDHDARAVGARDGEQESTGL